MGRKKTDATDPRRRLLETADRLFYQEGIHAVGIDRIVAEADVAKMTLYAHFGSKDGLIAAVLKLREEAMNAFLDDAMRRHAEQGFDPFRSFFAALKDWFQAPGFRGCIFQNTAVELADPGHEATRFAGEYKRRFTQTLRGLLEPELGDRAETLAPMIAVLVEGAIVTAVVQGSSDSADVAREAALLLVQSAKVA